MNADKILKKYEDENEMHFHQVDRQWIMEAMEEYAGLKKNCSPPHSFLVKMKFADYEWDAIVFARTDKQAIAKVKRKYPHHQVLSAEFIRCLC